jgi:hypothetical protein
MLPPMVAGKQAWPEGGGGVDHTAPAMDGRPDEAARGLKQICIVGIKMDKPGSVCVSGWVGVGGSAKLLHY